MANNKGLFGSRMANPDKVHAVMQPYTQALLGLAKKKKSPFAYTGNASLVKASAANHEMVKSLLGK